MKNKIKLFKVLITLCFTLWVLSIATIIASPFTFIWITFWMSMKVFWTGFSAMIISKMLEEYFKELKQSVDVENYKGLKKYK